MEEEKPVVLLGRARVRDDLLKGRFKLAITEVGNNMATYVGKRVLSDIVAYCKDEYLTDIKFPARIGRDIEFFDCRGERYEVYFFNPAYRIRFFRLGDFVLIVNYNSKTDRSRFFILKQIKYRKSRVSKGVHKECPKMLEALAKFRAERKLRRDADEARIKKDIADGRSAQ